MLNRPEEALSHFSTAARLTPGWHMTWALRWWQARTYRELGRLAESDAAADDSISLNPTWPHLHVSKALIAAQLGQDAVAHRQIEIARSLGIELERADRVWRRIVPNSPTLEADIAIIRRLFATTEP
jgi:hypothetical protein